MDQRTRRLVVAMGRQVLDYEQDHIRLWRELAILTESGLIDSHPRLLRSLYNNDLDYDDCVSDVLKSLVNENQNNLDIMLEHLGHSTWLKQNDPTEYSKLFGHSQLLVDDLRNRTVANSFELNQHLLRIEDALESDPEQAIGSTKELLESVVKTVLVAYGETITDKERFPTLLKRAQKRLNLDPSDLDVNVKGRDTVRKVLNSIGQVADGINELRNAYGSGHGRTRRSGITPRHARLAVNAGAALAVFLIETFEQHQSAEN